jgi:hypothetical protein
MATETETRPALTELTEEDTLFRDTERAFAAYRRHPSTCEVTQ